jgi:FlaA1/EpsC-like NDP-sugar epimerase
VVPLFKKQIEHGGPVTITDKRMVRYFMTITEAAHLVLEAGAISKRGEILVLDMGKPIKLLKLAEKMIKLYGFQPQKDIEIREIGIRPGEKLFEELLLDKENMGKTENNKIFIECFEVPKRFGIQKKMEILKTAVEEADFGVENDVVRRALQKVVPGYRSPEEYNSSDTCAVYTSID